MGSVVRAAAAAAFKPAGAADNTLQWCVTSNCIRVLYWLCLQLSCHSKQQLLQQDLVSCK